MIGHALATPVRTRVVVVDDHRTFADLLSFALQAEPDLDCVGIAHSAAEGVDLACRLRPDIVVMDIQMPGGDGLAATRRLREALPDTAVAILTALRDSDWVVRAAQAGASAFVPKDGSLQEMLEALRRLQNGGMVVTPSTFGIPEPRSGRAQDVPVPVLTRRERDVLDCLGKGMAPKTAARVLGISVNTCRGYVKALHAKLGVRSQVEMVIRAQQLGLLRDSDPP